MLQKLSIKNYILIHQLEIDLAAGFSVITGETGAGKSILLGALGLILGQRADSADMLDKEQKCVVEGLFNVKGYGLEGFFTAGELDYADQVILRREVAQGGKSRAFINDTPVNLSQLKDLGDRLVNIHSQHAVTTLNDANFQLAVIDSYAGIHDEVAAFRLGFARLADLKKQWEAARLARDRAAGEQDYNQFLLDELEQAALKPGEYEDLEAQLEALTHTGEIRNSLLLAGHILTGSDNPLLGQLTEAIHALNNVTRYSSDIKVLVERLNSNYIDIKDISKEISLLEGQVDLDPQALERISGRLDHLNRLFKKHQVGSTDSLIRVRVELEKKTGGAVDLENLISHYEERIRTLEPEMLAKAGKISERRHKVFPAFEKEVTGLLSRVGMTAARFCVECTATGQLTRDGIDRVRFMFSANRGMDPKDLASTASGGELSRLMLSIKSMISQKNLLPTIIFDEIDNGVSGEVAGKVGGILKKMGDNMQVIAITHLPQIAGKGDHHYWVYKTQDKKSTSTFIRKLSEKERVGEIAKMLSNEVVTDAAVKTAAELLKS